MKRSICQEIKWSGCFNKKFAYVAQSSTDFGNFKLQFGNVGRGQTKGVGNLEPDLLDTTSVMIYLSSIARWFIV